MVHKACWVRYLLNEGEIMLITIDVLGDDDDIKVDHDGKERQANLEKKQRILKEEFVRRTTQTLVIEVL